MARQSGGSLCERRVRALQIDPRRVIVNPERNDCSCVAFAKSALRWLDGASSDQAQIRSLFADIFVLEQ